MFLEIILSYLYPLRLQEEKTTCDRWETFFEILEFLLENKG